jgi:hypothetical protein
LVITVPAVATAPRECAQTFRSNRNAFVTSMPKRRSVRSPSSTHGVCVCSVTG